LSRKAAPQATRPLMLWASQNCRGQQAPVAAPS